jgi:hypothetical protein
MEMVQDWCVKMVGLVGHFEFLVLSPYFNIHTTSQDQTIKINGQFCSNWNCQLIVECFAKFLL